MPHVFSLPLGPSLGHQLLHTLLHHIHPILWRAGIPVSPHFCQVGDKGHPHCSPLPPGPDEPSLSSAVPHRPSLFSFSAVIDLTACYLGCSRCFTFLLSSPHSASPQQSWFWSSASSPALVTVHQDSLSFPFLIPCSHTLPDPDTFMHFFHFGQGWILPECLRPPSSHLTGKVIHEPSWALDVLPSKWTAHHVSQCGRLHGLNSG